MSKKPADQTIIDSQQATVTIMLHGVKKTYTLAELESLKGFVEMAIARAGGPTIKPCPPLDYKKAIPQWERPAIWPHYPPIPHLVDVNPWDDRNKVICSADMRNVDDLMSITYCVAPTLS